jgi:hypothetical protein
MSKLSELAAKYGTDKQEINHNYVKFYDFWLSNRKINSMLEVGFGPGGSAKMWLEYFPDAKIYVMDDFGQEFHDVWHDPNIDIPNLNIIKGSSLDPMVWSEVPYNLDFILDDGDHNPNSQIQSFMLGFSKLKSGGLYAIEDVHCNFETKYTDHDVIFPWLNGLMVNQQCPGYATEGDFFRFRGLMSWPSRDIYAYHVYKSVILFEKA